MLPRLLFDSPSSSYSLACPNWSQSALRSRRPSTASNDVSAMPPPARQLGHIPEYSFLYLTVSSVQEGLFLYNHSVSPYDGGVYHQAPLLLPLFSLLPSFVSWPVFTYLLYIAIDLLSANAILTIANSGEAGVSAHFTSPRKNKGWSGTVVAAL